MRAASLPVLFLVVLAAAAASLAALATPAGAIISDPSAEPVWTAYPHGSFNGEDEARDVAIAGNGDVFVCGSNITMTGRAVALSKFVDGDIQWGGTINYHPTTHTSDSARAIALGPRSVVYTAGLAERAGHGQDVLLVKWSATSGRRLWTRVYDGRGGGDDGGLDVAVDRRGNVIVLGVTEGRDGHADWLARSYTSSGRVRWTWHSDWSDDEDAAAVELVVARDGSVCATGFAAAGGSPRMATVRLSSAGRRLWSRTYRGPDGNLAAGTGIAPRPGGGVYVCGYTNMDDTLTDGLVVAYTANGRRSVFDLNSSGWDPTIESFNDIAVTSTGDVVACGYTTSGMLMQPNWMVWSPDGHGRATFTITSPGSDSFKAVAADAWGGYYVTGKRTTAGGVERVFTERRSTIALGGTWSSQLEPGPTTGNQAVAIAVRGGRCVVVGQADLDGATGLDQMIAAYIY